MGRCATMPSLASRKFGQQLDGHTTLPCPPPSPVLPLSRVMVGVSSSNSVKFSARANADAAKVVPLLCGPEITILSYTRRSSRGGRIELDEWRGWISSRRELRREGQPPSFPASATTFTSLDGGLLSPVRGEREPTSLLDADDNSDNGALIDPTGVRPARPQHAQPSRKPTTKAARTAMGLVPQLDVADKGTATPITENFFEDDDTDGRDRRGRGGSVGSCRGCCELGNPGVPAAKGILN
eukprot:CAMPEP_0183301940 /NCGR_PEP_ID=MMETSP0160_2-20130417/7903_1 /TAXON_ID=2839 ORGANISM="Odontella Sinensis, Strain Grunow 1884" /NCGR_SAMPLE_ID=MMETSP0160_2 /ASSEMBLY_ACC=CAM_ASM_000250 /LENGTH=239 /DNA_ID=CAMNT_0025464651 /DNA_START=393 /DNA_END=1109 /DNA_ORIENTATION=-